MEQDRNVGEKPTLNKTIHLFFKSMLKKKLCLKVGQNY